MTPLTGSSALAVQVGALKEENARLLALVRDMREALTHLTHKHPNGFWYSFPSKRLDELALDDIMARADEILDSEKKEAKGK